MTGRNRAFLLAGLLLALVLAGGVSYYASSLPDGLEKVSADKGISRQARAHHADGSPLAGYETKGVHNGRLSAGAAGVVGVLLTFALGGGLFYVVRRRGPSSADPEPRARDDQPARTG